MPRSAKQQHQQIVKTVRRAILLRLVRSRRLHAALVFVGLLLTSCGMPPILDTDWCYRYDFREDDYDANVQFGSWQDGLGFVTSEAGNMVMVLNHDQTVQPAYLSATLRRGLLTSGQIAVSVEAHVFGFSSTFGGALPAELDAQEVRFDLGNTVSGTQVNVGIAADQTVYFESLEVRGRGDNPFSTINCDLTPTPPPDTPTSTSSPTLTPTDGPSPTLTATAEDNPFFCFYDFTVDQYIFSFGLTEGNPNAEWTLGTGYTTAPVESADYDYIQIGTSFTGLTEDTHFTRILFNVDYTGTLDPTVGWRLPNGADGPSAHWTNYSGSDVDLGLWEGDYVTVHGTENVQFEGNIQRFTDGTFTISSALIQGYGLNAICPEGSPQTATPSNTPTPSRTPSNTPTPSRTPLLIQSPTRTPSPGPSATPGAPTNTPTPNPTNTTLPLLTPAITVTPNLTATPEGGGDDPGNPIVKCGDDDEISTLECILKRLTEFINWSVAYAHGASDYFVSAVNWAAGTARNFGTQISNFFALVGGLFNIFLRVMNAVLAIVNLLIQIIRHLLDLVILWFQQLMNAMGRIFSDYQSAFPEPIPFLPQCHSNPTGSQFCAVLYIFAYTVFGGTLGQIILAVLVVIIDLSLIFLFVFGVRRIVRTVQGVT
jgi:hypothetical protein